MVEKRKTAIIFSFGIEFSVDFLCVEIIMFATIHPRDTIS